MRKRPSLVRKPPRSNWLGRGCLSQGDRTMTPEEAQIVAWLDSMIKSIGEPNTEWCAAQKIAFEVTKNTIETGICRERQDG